MKPTDHHTNNEVLPRPGNPLPVTHHGDVWTSFWQPDAEELAALNTGGSVALQIHSRVGHPPVSVRAVIPENPQQKPGDYGTLSTVHQAVVLRHRATVSILKFALSEWAKENAESPVRREITDLFLDLMNVNQGREPDPLAASMVSSVEMGLE